MSNYRIITDNFTDLPEDFFEKHNVGRLYASCIIDDVVYDEKNPLDIHQFYQKVRGGAMPTTSQVSIEAAIHKLSAWVKEVPQLVCIIISSGLSGSWNSVCVAAEQVMEENPGTKITVIDSRAATIGEGVLVHRAAKMMEAGMEYDELVETLNKERDHIVTAIAVEDLFHLQRGGRLSKTTAVLGSMVQIKPVLHIDEEGKLVPFGKARGRRRSIMTLVDAMEGQMGSRAKENDTVFIAHADCADDAEMLRKAVEDKYGIHNFVVEYMGPTIGTHAGPGTLALCYVGDRK